MTRLLIVDDESSVLSALQRALRQRFGGELEVAIETDAMQALDRARRETFDVVISDLRMPEIDGVAFLSLIGALQPDSVRMILTGSADFETAQRAIQDAGVFRYLTKPWVDAEVAAHVRAAIEQGAVNRAAGLLAGIG
jgi:DNA-binding NtrC family response regulator